MRLLKIPEAASYVFRRQRLAKLRKSLENGYTLPATGVSPPLSPSFPLHLSRKGPSRCTLEHDFSPFSRARVHPGAPLSTISPLFQRKGPSQRTFG